MSVGYSENLKMRDYLLAWLKQEIERACAPDDGWGPVFANPTDETIMIVKALLQVSGRRGDVLWSPRQEAEWHVPELSIQLVRHARVVGMFEEAA